MMDGLQPPIPGKVAFLQATDLVQLLFFSDLVTLRCVWGEDPLGLQLREISQEREQICLWFY